MSQFCRLLVGDCRDVLRGIPNASVDAVVTDPPYELGFMAKSWDRTGIAYNVALWQEVLRVLKPGSHLLAFGGTRTSHRMVCEIEDAGMEIRDSILWIYATGFPKSVNVSAHIDQRLGRAREVAGPLPNPGSTKPRRSMGDGCQPSPMLTMPASDAAKQWDGWGTALKPSHEPICLARAPLAESTIAAQVLATGTGALNIDASRVGSRAEDPQHRPASASGIGNGGVAYGTRAGQEATYTQGRWPANTVYSHSVLCRPLGSKTVKSAGLTRTRSGKNGYDGGWGPQAPVVGTDPDGTETVAAYACVPSCPIFILDQQSGERPGPGSVAHSGSATAWPGGKVQGTIYPKETGGASRFFRCFHPDDDPADDPGFIYTPKPSAAERSCGLAGRNQHATVKPLALMAYLVKLICPVAGVVLDPFMGSGSTGLAALGEGFSFIGIDQDAGYVALARQRLGLLATIEEVS